MTTETLRAEPGLVRLLGRIDGSGCHTGGGSEIEQHRADNMLARIAWSRIAEPGDGIAGQLAAAIGVEASLALLVNGSNAAHIWRLVHEAVGNEAGGLAEKALAEALERWRPRLNRNETVGDVERAVSTGLRVVLPGDTLWPTALEDLGVHGPNMLWVRGNPEALSAYSLAVVGARAATGYGSHVTAELVDGACRAGLAIVSGAAYGIDAVAHRTALAAGAVTVAVVAGGADRPYPRAHETLLDRIASDDSHAGGVVCSEMVPDSAPTRWRFLQRNRLISALSRAVLVPEAGVNSGSLNTAGHASQLGRPIGAVPGPVTSAASAGCHKLIRDYDATLITSVREVCELANIDEMFALFGADEVNASVDADGAEVANTEPRESAWARRVGDALPLRGTRDVETIAKLSGLTVSQVTGVLCELEMLGKVKRRENPIGDSRRREHWGLVKPDSS